MAVDRERHRWHISPRVALVIAGAIVLAIVLYLGRSALAPFLIGLVLIYILDPGVEGLSKRGVPRVLSVLIVYLVAFTVLIGGVALLLRPLVQQVADFARDLPALASSIDAQLRQLGDVYERLQLPAPLREAIDRAIANMSSGQGGGGSGLSGLLPVARTVLGTLAALFGILVIPVWAFYILKDRNRLIASVDKALPVEWRRDTWAVLRIIERVFGRWLRGQLLLALVVGAATFVGLLILGQFVDGRFFQFAILLAVIAGIFELLPIVGPILSMIPTLLIALTVSPQAVVAVIVLYLIVQQLENNVLVPKIQGEAIELHPSVVIFALVIGGAIAGFLGAIFSLPVTAAARDVFRYLFNRVDEHRDPGTAEEVVEIEPGPPTAVQRGLTEAARDDDKGDKGKGDGKDHRAREAGVGGDGTADPSPGTVVTGPG